MSQKKQDEREQLSPLSDRDRDLFLAALDRPVRPMPEAIRKAKACHDAMVVSDNEKPKIGQ